MEVVSFLGVAGEGIDKRECSVKKRLDMVHNAYRQRVWVL